MPHQLLKGNEAISAFIDPFDRLVRKTGIRKLFDKLLVAFLPHIIRLLAKLGVVRFNSDVAKAQTTRSRVIWEEARRRGIEMEQLVIFGKPSDFYRAAINGRMIYFESLPIPDFLDLSAQEWLDDKVKLKKKLLEAGLPAARGGGFTEFEWKHLLRVFNMLHKPVIIKPALGSRGRHTTTFINTEKELRQAFKAATQIAHYVVMEEHLFGSVYRATIVNGKLVGVLRGDPPRITGDGRHTITELIERKNLTRPAEVKEFELTPYSEQFLERNGYTPKTILPVGKQIDLIEKIGVGYGGYKAEEIEIAHPETKRILEEAGRLVNFPVMGFDFIIADITRAPHEQQWGIIECNSLPFIDLHHFPLEGAPINVAAHVWDLWSLPAPDKNFAN